MPDPIPLRPHPPGLRLETLAGVHRAALRRPGQPTWLLVSRDRLVGGEVPLGVYLELEREDQGRRDSLTAQRALPAGGLIVPTLRLGIPAATVVAVVLVVLTMMGLVRGASLGLGGFVGAVESTGALVVAMVIVAVSFSFLRWVEGSLLSSTLQGRVDILRMRHGTVRVEPVCWRLGSPWEVPAATVGLALVLFMVSATWRRVDPGASVGVGVGAFLYLVQALYPLRPGPGAALLEALTGLSDVPTRLRWTLVSRFVPVPSRLEVAGGPFMAWVSGAFAVWAVGTVAALDWMATPPATGAALPGRIWQMVLAATLVGFALWMAALVARLLVSAHQLHAGAAVKPMAVSEHALAQWRLRNPLVRHVPSLADAQWRWGTVPRGGVLIRFGSRDRHFLWIVDGRVSVLGRSDSGDPVLLADLGAGAGVGEVALLDGGHRTADIVAVEDCVVGVLEHDAFASATSAEDRDRFRDLVRASQALARAPHLAGLSADERARWLAEGTPLRVEEGTLAVAQGERHRWMGLVVEGRLDVIRDGARVAEMGPDEILGEIAYLDGTPRGASLRASTDVLIWRWDAPFLDGTIGQGPLRDVLRALAGERTS